MLFLARLAAPKMKPGAVILNTTSIQADDPSPGLLAYASTKAAIANFTSGLAQLLAKDGIRVNAVAPGPVWTPLIPSTMSAENLAIRREHAPGSPGPARRTRARLRIPRLGRRKLHHRRSVTRNGWPTDAVTRNTHISLAPRGLGYPPVPSRGVVHVRM